MLQLSKQWRASCLPADAQQASGPRHISPRNPNPNGSGLRKTLRRTSLSVFAVALGALCASWPGMAAGPDQTTEKKLSQVVETKEGAVQGFISDGVTEFLGIPYAEPPVGNLRWQPLKPRNGRMRRRGNQEYPAAFYSRTSWVTTLPRQ